jgi:hypothetical protein
VFVVGRGEGVTAPRSSEMNMSNDEGEHDYRPEAGYVSDAERRPSRCVRRLIAIAQNGASRSPISAHADRTKRRIAIT